MEKHARERLKERYHKTLTTSLRNALVRRVEQGRCFICNNRPEKTGVRVYCWYKDVKYKFIFDPVDKEIITFLG